MPLALDVPSLMALTPVKPERADEFEAFFRDVVVPAVAQSRPQAAGRWQLLRPGAIADSSRVVNSPGVATARADTYVFVFYGDLPLDEWALGPVFAEVHGEEKGAQLARKFDDFVDGDQVICQFSGQV